MHQPYVGAERFGRSHEMRQVRGEKSFVVGSLGAGGQPLPAPSDALTKDRGLPLRLFSAQWPHVQHEVEKETLNHISGAFDEQQEEITK